MADQERLQYLFDQYLRRACTREEVEELIAILQDETAEDMLSPRMQDLWEQVKQGQKAYPVDWQRMYRRIKDAGPPGRTGRPSVRTIVFRVAAAVAVLLMLTGGWYWWQKDNASQKNKVAAVPGKEHDVSPGGNKAILTLANGATILLNQAANGTIARQGHSQVIKLDSGELAYQPAAGGSPGTAVQYNSLATPRGGQYRLRLPDGTEVWLNAASSIRYPTVFTGKERQVEVTGEAYFEVAPDAGKPFVVDADRMQIKVLGTHFNVNAYADETAIRATLLEGSIKIQSLSGHGKALVIAPGQQARLDKEGNMQLVKKADINEAVAWKNGLFVFHHDDLPAIMRRLARWYDVQVEYKGNKVPSSHFTGAVRRNVNLSEVFKMLQLTGGAHFDIEGKTIIVTP